MSRGAARPCSWLAGAVLCLAVVVAARAAEPMPVMARSAPGRFEIAARDSVAAHAVAALAEETWRLLEGPLALPAAFSTPVFVRLGDEAESVGTEIARATVEPGGVVSLWIRWAAVAPLRDLQRQALVRGLLLRQAVAMHGAGAPVSAPLWLETAAAEWCAVRVNPAGVDALKQRSQWLRPDGLADIFAAANAEGAGAERFAANAVWLMTFLQAESTRAGEWAAFLRLVLAGEVAENALAAAYPGRFASVNERELWWATGLHHHRRGRSLPTLDAPDSRAEVAHLARFVAAPDEADVLVPLREVLEHSDEVFIAAELKRRAAELGRLAPALHPFYRNAALSLAVACESVVQPAAKRDAAVAQFEADWRDANDLERASRAVLDALEQRPSGERDR